MQKSKQVLENLKQLLLRKIVNKNSGSIYSGRRDTGIRFALRDPAKLVYFNNKT